MAAKQRVDAESVLKLVLNGEQAKTSAYELEKAYKKMNNELLNMNKLNDPKAYEEKKKNALLVKAAWQEAKKEIAGVNQESKNVNATWKDIAKGILASGAFQSAIGYIKEFGSQVIETTVKFQKLEAVLSTTLGSKSSAHMAMKQIQQFAAATPFQVDELTDSYVKLANQGFKPTMEQMRGLGDLAAATGKGYDQLTEAIIDAQVGEFERLKEFGIRAQKHGDEVSFTFKGVTTTVKNTSDAIREYIVGLGNVEGVSGSMAEVSKTLGGQISNLNDGWDILLKTVGEETSGVFSGAISIMGMATEKLTNYLHDLNTAQKYNAPGTGFWERVSAIPSQLGLMPVNVQAVKRQAFTQVSDKLDEQIGNAKYYRELIDIQEDLNERMKKVDKSTREGSAAFALYKDKIAIVKDKWDEIGKQRNDEKLKKESEAQQKAREEAEKRRKEHEKMEKQLEKEHKALDKTIQDLQADFNIDGLTGLEQKLAEINKKYDPLIEKAQKFKDAAQLKILTALKEGEQDRATSADQKKQADDFQKENSAEFRKTENNINQGYGERSNELKGALANGDLSQQDYDQQQYDLENEKLLSLQLLAEAYGEDSLKYEEELSNRKLEQKKKELDQKKTLAEAEAAIEEAKLQNFADGVSLLKGLVNQRGAAFKALLVMEKAIAISQVIIRTQKEIAGYYEAYATMPGGFIAASGFAAAAKVRAGISIATIAAQGVREWVNSNKSDSPASGKAHATGVRNAPGGKALVGEAGQELVEENGYWWLTDGPQLVDLQRGANVYSAAETARMLKGRSVDEQLYAAQRRSNAQIGINTSAAIEAERMFRYGGVSPVAVGVGSASGQGSVVNVTPAAMSTAALEVKLDRLIEATEGAWNYRVLEEKQEKVKKIRDSVGR